MLSNLRPRNHLGVPGSPTSLSERLSQCHTPGASIALMHNFQVAWEHQEGVLDAVKGGAVDRESLFLAASISKVVNAVLVMRLGELGRCDIDEDVNRYLKRWTVPPNGEWQPRVTLRQLLSHTAGFNVGGFPGYTAGAQLPTLPQILDGEGNTEAVRVTRLPGLACVYSGGGTTVSQLVVEDITGELYKDVAHKLVLAPLGMSRSSFEDRPSANFAAGHPVCARLSALPSYELINCVLGSTSQSRWSQGLFTLRRRLRGSGLQLQSWPRYSS